MKGDDRHRRSGTTRLPLAPFPHRTVGDLAQRAMPSPEPRTDPVAELSAKGAVCVVHVDKPDDAKSPDATLGDVIAPA